MADPIVIDPAIYNAPEYQTRERAVGQPAQADAPATPAQVPLTSGLSPRSEAQGAAAVEEAGREATGIADSMGAAVQSWGAKRIWDAYQGPTFAAEPGFSPTTRLRTEGIQLTVDEEQFLLKSTSTAEYNDKLQTVKTERENNRMIGDHPLLAGLTMMLDPTYIAIDIASMGATRALRLGNAASRVSAAALAGGGAYGVGLAEQEVSPISDRDIITNALVNGAASALVFRGGRLEKAMPDFPEAELGDTARKFQSGDRPPATPAQGGWKQQFNEAGEPLVSKSGKPVWKYEPEAAETRSPDAPAPVRPVDPPTVPSTASKLVREAEDIGGVPGRADGGLAALRGIANKMDEYGATLVRNLEAKVGPALDGVTVKTVTPQELKGMTKNGTEHYRVDENTVYVSTLTRPEVVLHELAHGVTAAKIKYGRAVPNSEHGKLYRELERVRKQAVKAMNAGDVPTDSAAKYLTKNVEELVAGLYTGTIKETKAFREALSKLPDVGRKQSVLTTVVQALKQLLGMAADESNALTRALGLTDELLDLPGVRWDRGVLGVDNAPQFVAQQVDSLGKRTGDTIAWNLHKTLSKFSKTVADKLVDDPLNYSGNSAVSQKQAIKSELSTIQFQFEDQIRDALKKQGLGHKDSIFRPKKYAEAQSALMEQVTVEMLSRERAARKGVIRQAQGVPKEVTEMADTLQKLADNALAEMKRAGVPGAEDLEAKVGYFSRKWDGAKIEALMEKLGGEEIGRPRLTQLVKGSLRRVNGFDDELAQDIAHSLIDRAIRKGRMEDTSFRAHAGYEAISEIRDMLKSAGLEGKRLQRALEVMAGVVDEAGKPALLKHRMDLDALDAIPLPDGSKVRIMDMIDTNLHTITDRYVDRVSGQAALARVGMPTTSDLGKARAEMLAGIKTAADRKEAAELFDNITNSLMGLPIGESLPPAMRKMSAVTNMVGLASSGMWQVTEYSTAMQRFGALRTVKYALATLPGFKGLVDDVKAGLQDPNSLQSVLARQSFQDIRMRPLVQRFEDNFEMPKSDQVMLGLEQAKQVVPYLNAMKYVHHHQANMVANLITDTVQRAVNGGKREAEYLRQFGIESQVLDTLRSSIKQHGLNVQAWDDAAWDAVRPAFAKMTDDSVLRNRMGEIPAFAQFSQLGKFIFTYRSFVLGAHNKILSGTLSRSGLMGATQLMLYQFPLAFLTVQADNAIKGKKSMTDEEAVMKGISQMGALGLFSEVWGLVSGQKQQFGAPGLIAADRLYKTVGMAASGNVGGTAQSLINSVPLLPLIPGLRAIGETLKE